MGVAPIPEEQGLVAVTAAPFIMPCVPPPAEKQIPISAANVGGVISTLENVATIAISLIGILSALRQSGEPISLCRFPAEGFLLHDDERHPRRTLQISDATIHVLSLSLQTVL